MNINTIKVKQFDNEKGLPVKNQFIIWTRDGKYFQSYDSIIAFIPKDEKAKIQLDKTYWDYSTTTSKYRNQFLGLDTKQTGYKIALGEFELVNLNPDLVN